MTNEHDSLKLEIETAFTSYIAERAAAGVVMARSVSSVRYEDRIVTVTLDPTAAGYEVWTVRETSAFENLADLFGTPIAFDDEIGLRLRPHIDRIETRLIDGTSWGSRTTVEMHIRATGRSEG